MRARVATRGPLIGQCNICGSTGRLTEDHTPPKGCVRPTQVEIQSLLQRLSSAPPPVRPRLSQDGVKYRTLCSRCNSDVLGARCDPALITFVNEAATILRSPLDLPTVLSVPARSQAIARSVLGHLAAQGVGRYRKGPATQQFRDYMLDETLALPAAIRIFYWLHPYRHHVMARDSVYLDMGAGDPFSMWFLKFYPLGFMVAWNGPEVLPFPVQCLDP